MKIAKTQIEITLTKADEERLLSLVGEFEDGFFCDGCECYGVTCAECPLNTIDEMAKDLRIAVLDFINKAKREG